MAVKKYLNVRNNLNNMDKKTTMLNYLNCLETAEYDKMMKLFDKDAIVNSPLRGIIKADEFYRDLFNDTQSSKITLLNIFTGDKPNISAGHFRYDWVLSDGTLKHFECIDVFEFEGEKIKHLTIIYDTYNLRKAYKKIRQK